MAGLECWLKKWRDVCCCAKVAWVVECPEMAGQMVRDGDVGGWGLVGGRCLGLGMCLGAGKCKVRDGRMRAWGEMNVLMAGMTGINE